MLEKLAPCCAHTAAGNAASAATNQVFIAPPPVGGSAIVTDGTRAAARGLQVQRMTLNKIKAWGFAAALPLPAAAGAQAPGSAERFESLDRNGDGFVSRDEGKDADELNTRFSELDVNNDNQLSLDEYALLEREAREAAVKTRRDRQASRRSSAAGGSK